MSLFVPLLFIPAFYTFVALISDFWFCPTPPAFCFLDTLMANFWFFLTPRWERWINDGKYGYKMAAPLAR